MDKVTGEQCREAWEKAGKRHWIGHHKCGGCGLMVGYHFIETGPAFDSNCDCAPDWTPARHLTWDAFADETMNMQTPEIRAAMWERFKAGRPTHERD